MKTSFLLVVGLLTFNLSSFADETAPREIEIKTEKIGEAVHWVPEKIEVKPGEKVILKVNHVSPGGFDFHGFQVKALKVEKKIDRDKPVTIPVTMPKKEGEYKISCQFHPKHVPAMFVVKP